MHFISLEVWHWRGLEHQVLDGLSEQLNLVAGPNESGKSRLFEAVRYGMFESSKGTAQHKRELQSWSGAGGAPRVRIEFVARAERFTVDKQFLKHPYTRLAGGGEALEGPAAEARLRELLGTGRGKSTGVPAEDRGLWRLLWLEQGGSRITPEHDLNPEARANLQSALARQVGEATAGRRGQRILAAAATEAARYWTPTFQPTGPLRQAQRDSAGAAKELEAAVERRDSARKAARRLEESRRLASELAQRLGKQATRLQQASGKASEASRLRQELTQQEGAEQLLRLQAAKAAETHAARLAAEQRRAKLDGEVTAAVGELGQAAAKTGSLRRRHGELGVTVRQAETLRQQARVTAAQARRRRDSVAARTLCATLRERHTKARALHASLQRLDARRSELTLTREGLATLRKRAAVVDRLRAQLDVAAVRLTVRAHRAVEVDEVSLAAGATRVRTVVEATAIRLGEVATLEIAPGGAGLAKLRDKLADAQAALSTALAGAGVTSVDGAEAALRARADLEHELQVVRGELGQLAPAGFPALAAELQAAEARVEALGPADEDGPTVEHAEAEEEAAERAWLKARDTRDALITPLEAAAARQARLEQLVQGLQQERERLDAQLDAGQPAATLETARAGLEREHGDTLRRIDSLRADFEQLGGTGAQRALEQAQRALEQLRSSQHEAERDSASAAAELELYGGEGLHEQVQDAAAKLATVQEHERRVTAHATARRLLLTTLRELHRKTQERFAAPVRKQVEPALRQLFPGSRLAFDERGAIAGLTSDEVVEPFGALSGGAQEQLSTLVRIGLARVLAEHERLPLILDDALVNTDSQRLETMLRLLGEAASVLQIIVFTCHDADFDGLGGHRVFRLPGGRQ